MSTIHRLDQATINATTIRAITEASTTSNVDLVESMGSADIARSFIGHGTQAPEIRFTTQDIAAVLVTAGVVCEGLALASTSYQYWKIVPQVGRTLRTAESHRRDAVAQGTFYWDTLTLPNNDIGTISVVLAATYNGSVAPIVHAGSQALPAGALTSASYFGCGPIQINGTLIGDIQEVTINTNTEVELKYSDSIPWPVGAYIKRVAPQVQIRTQDQAVRTSIGLVGGALNGTTGLAVYGRKFVNAASGGLQRVANATAEHLRIVCPDGTYRIEEGRASDNEPAEAVITVDVGVGDSADLLMTFASNVAIPTS